MGSFEKMSEKKEEYYLDINGVISFKEFVVSMRKGSLKNQISSILDKQFPEAEALGPIMIGTIPDVLQEVLSILFRVSESSSPR